MLLLFISGNCIFKNVFLLFQLWSSGLNHVLICNILTVGVFCVAGCPCGWPRGWWPRGLCAWLPGQKVPGDEQRSFPKRTTPSSRSVNWLKSLYPHHNSTSSCTDTNILSFICLGFEDLNSSISRGSRQSSRFLPGQGGIMCVWTFIKIHLIINMG